MDVKICTCIRCGSTEDLLMYPHRLEDRLVGWVFACKDCEKAVAGAELHVHYEVKSKTEEVSLGDVKGG